MTVATAAQTGYLVKLIEGKQLPNVAWAARAQEVRGLINDGALDKKTASAAIESLKGLPWKPKDTDASPAEEGYYVLDGGVYRVRTSKNTGHRYAVQLTITPTASGTRYSWEYTKGVVYRLATAEKLTVEEAAERGHLDGVCIICCKPLTDPESVKRGIGPVCVTKL